MTTSDALLPLPLRLMKRQFKAEAGSGTWLAVHGNCDAVQVQDALDNGQAKPRMSRARGPAPVTAKKAVEYPVAVLLGYAGAAVLDLEANVAAGSRCRTQYNRSTGRGMLYGIVHEVVDDALNQADVAHDQR